MNPPDVVLVHQRLQRAALALAAMRTVDHGPTEWEAISACGSLQDMRTAFLSKPEHTELLECLSWSAYVPPERTLNLEIKLNRWKSAQARALKAVAEVLRDRYGMPYVPVPQLYVG